MKIIFILLTLVGSVAVATAQEGPLLEIKPAPGQVFTIGDPECGSQVEESQTHDYRYGKVIEITADNRLVVELAEIDFSIASHRNGIVKGSSGSTDRKSEIFTVTPVGIDRSYHRSALNKFLREKFSGNKVSVTGNAKGDTINAVVWLESDEDNFELNTYLLENGIARFVSFEPGYEVSNTMPCLLEKAERRAREAKVGIWAK